MSNGDQPLAFDPVLTQPVRMAIVATLMARQDATFVELRDLLGLTQGNLGIHLQKLEDARYVKVTKRFVGRKPQTKAAMSATGRRAFLAHVEQLRAIADNPVSE